MYSPESVALLRGVIVFSTEEALYIANIVIQNSAAKCHLQTKIQLNKNTKVYEAVHHDCNRNLLLFISESRNFLVKWYNSHDPLEQRAMEKN